MAKKVKLSDIAECLSVSTVTVSKALAGKSGVSDELRQEIVELAAKMGYEKDVKSKEKESHSIGVLVEERFVSGEQSFYWNLYQRFSYNAIRKNAAAYLEVITPEMEEENSFPNLISDNRVEGLVIMGSFDIRYREFLKKRVKKPMVFMDTDSGDGSHDSVVSDNIMGGYEMTNYLFDKGYKKIGYVGLLHETDSIDDRFLGYLKSYLDHDARPLDEWIIPDRTKHRGIFLPDEWRIFEGKLPDAFFCNCDVAALSLIKKFNNDGIRVPEDIAIVGFDNYINGAEDDFVTTYALSPDNMAKRTLHIILHKIEDEKYLAGKFVLGGHIIERKSA